MSTTEMDAPMGRLGRLLRAGIEHAPPDEQRFVVTTNTLAIVAGALALLNLPWALYFLPATRAVAVFMAIIVVFYAACPWLVSRGHALAARLLFNLLAVAGFGAMTLEYGTDTDIQILHLWVILAAFFIYPKREDGVRYAIVALAFACFAGSYAFLTDRPPRVRLEPELQAFVRFAALASFVALTFAILYYNQRFLRQAEAALARERARSESLLANTLPAPIVARLKAAPGEPIADAFPEATVLFADIVGFTKLASERSPASLIVLLNEIFSAFDRLVDTRGLEKIKTIGDAYMAVSGLPVTRPDHVATACAVAPEMIETLAKIAEAEDVDLQIRIGIHTGPVAAGVIGIRKFAYDLWGDTVNVASRMESHGVPGRVHVSRAVVDAMHDSDVAFTPRGVIEVKGKGPVETFFLGGTTD